MVGNNSVNTSDFFLSDFRFFGLSYRNVQLLNTINSIRNELYTGYNSTTGGIITSSWENYESLHRESESELSRKLSEGRVFGEGGI